MKKLLLSAVATAILMSAGQNASAHISYSGRNFGTLEVGGAAVVIGNQTISSSFGWADATDENWGDSHRGRFFRFTLDRTASVIITVSRNSLGTHISNNSTANTFLPAVSLYSGLAVASAYDTSAVSVDWRLRNPGSEGSLNTLGTFSIGNDAGELGELMYVGNAADGNALNYGNATDIEGDGNADGFLTATFLDLPPGDYSFFVGGANYEAQTNETPTYPTYGVFVSAQAIAATPAPTPAPTVSSSTADTKSIKSLAEALGLNANGKSNKRLRNEIEKELKKASANSEKKTKSAKVNSNSKKSKSRE